MPSLPDHLMPAPIGRERLPREVMEEHQRARVLDAATEVFAKRGYQGTTVDHIVSAASIGVGSFYSLFEGKQDCFLAVYERIVAEGRERILAALPADAPWPRRTLACLKALLELIEERPLAARVALVEVQTAGSEALARHQSVSDEVSKLLAEGREHSTLGPLPATLEYATVGGLTWFLQQRIAGGETANATALLPEVLEIVLEPYLGEKATAELATV